jgi:hypothetical protein
MKNKNLHNIKSSGFKAPNGYLESFDELLLKKLKETSPLDGLENSGFKVPDQYFETFDEKLSKVISTKEEAKVISFLSWKKMAYVSGVAASILLMITLFNNNNKIPSFDNLETALIDEYIVEEDFTNEDIATLLSDDLTMNNFMDSHLINDNLEEYILDNSSAEDYLKEENK